MRDYSKRRMQKFEKFMRFLSILKDQQLTWSEMLKLISEKDIRISEATLSRYLRNAMNQMLVMKNIDDKGKVVYSLTAKGHLLLEEFGII